MLVNLPNLNFYKEKQLKTLQQEFEFKAKKIVLDKIKYELKKQIHSLKILKKTLDAIRTDFQTRARLQSILNKKQIEFRDYFLAYNLFRGKQLYEVERLNSKNRVKPENLNLILKDFEQEQKSEFTRICSIGGNKF